MFFLSIGILALGPTLAAAGNLLGDRVDDPLREPPTLLDPAGLDAAAQARLHEAHHHPRHQGHDLHQAGLPGHCPAHQQARGADQ